MTTELEYSAEQTSRKELSDVYARLQAAHQIIGYLTKHMDEAPTPMTQDWVTRYVAWQKKSLKLIKSYGDINGN